MVGLLLPRGPSLVPRVLYVTDHQGAGQGPVDSWFSYAIVRDEREGGKACPVPSSTIQGNCHLRVIEETGLVFVLKNSVISAEYDSVSMSTPPI